MAHEKRVVYNIKSADTINVRDLGSIKREGQRSAQGNWGKMWTGLNVYVGLWWSDGRGRDCPSENNTKKGLRQELTSYIQVTGRELTW